MDPTAPPTWLSYGFPLFFAATWMGAMWTTSIMSGWRSLSEKYPLQREFNGTWKKWQTGTFGWCSYKSCLWVGTTADGLYLQTGPWRIFRLGHPPLYIPWRAIKEARIKKVFWQEFYEFKLEDPRVTIKLTKSSLDNVRAYLPQLKD